MRAEPWMDKDTRSLGQKLSDMQDHVRRLRQEAEKHDKLAKGIRDQANEMERQIENMRNS